jgi:membrane fusion protein (multidrug efflux system)
VLGGDNKVAIRTVKIGDPFGSERIVTEGLNAGDRVVAEGIQKVRPGMQVNPRPFSASKDR